MYGFVDNERLEPSQQHRVCVDSDSDRNGVFLFVCLFVVVVLFNVDVGAFCAEQVEGGGRLDLSNKSEYTVEEAKAGNAEPWCARTCG